MKEIAQHLRFVHFTVVLTSLALLAAATLDAPSEAARADAQLREIIGAMRNWEPSFLTDRAQEAAHAVLGVPEQFILRFEARPEGFGAPTFFTSIEGPYGQAEADVLRVSDIDPPTSLAGFADLWDGLNDCCRLAVPVRFADRVAVSRIPLVGEVEAQPLRWFAVDISSGAPGVHRRLALRTRPAADDVIEIGGGVLPGAWVLRGSVADRASRWPVSLPVTTRVVAFDAQQALQDQLRTSWLGGAFDFSFRELSRVTEGYRNVDLNILGIIVESEARRAGQQIETFGLKLPAAVVGVWGLPILLAVQLYFLVNLVVFAQHAFAEPEPANVPPVPWIALYPGLLPRLLMLSSAVILPLSVHVAVTAMHVGRVGEPGLGLAWIAAVATAGVLAALATLRLTFLIGHGRSAPVAR